MNNCSKPFTNIGGRAGTMQEAKTTEHSRQGPDCMALHLILLRPWDVMGLKQYVHGGENARIFVDLGRSHKRSSTVYCTTGKRYLDHQNNGKLSNTCNCESQMFC